MIYPCIMLTLFGTGIVIYLGIGLWWWIDDTFFNDDDDDSDYFDEEHW